MSAQQISRPTLLTFLYVYVLAMHLLLDFVDVLFSFIVSTPSFSPSLVISSCLRLSLSARFSRILVLSTMLCIDPVLGLLLLLVVIPCNDLLCVSHCATVCARLESGLS